MIKSLIVVFSIIVGMSPIWPLGDPSPGDPLIIINKKTNHLAFFKDKQLVMEVPIATGKTNDLTPEGLFTLIVKAKDPYYRKKDIPGGDPENPLGARWLGFDARGTDGRTYGIHGTNNPASIGHYLSNGCVRMRNEDVIRLYDIVPIGTKVFVTNINENFWQLAKEQGVL